ncbi:major facilitator superfamily domain-containing protein [Ilyonectria robusta]|uniref:major facilitator superfamily domain-containing protein n=1 Tax=Ilyonectria robusta TaxID=1079257 RepID=UPI001E8E9772|nr:major facilitator superfamily domain-containing protein [Ilyonectria robusta]KAH8667161.1 major facilitator superfamily domain-containing protein [Ilyonectria robusta]
MPDKEVGKTEGVQAQSLDTSAQCISDNTVPDEKHHGFLGWLSLIPEIENPYHYGKKAKWLITGVVAIAAATAPMGASIFYPATPDMSRDLQVSSTVINLSVAFYLLSSSIFPLWWSSFSETAGRRTILIISFLLHVIFTFVCGMSNNIAMLVVFRLLSGGAAASGQSVGAGTIADIWRPEERGYAMSIFYLGPLAGPLFLPLVGGALTEKFGWRSTIWFLTGFGILVLVLILLALPETLSVQRKVEASSLDAAQRTAIAVPASQVHPFKRMVGLVKRCMVEPLRVVVYLRFPAVAIVIYCAAVAFGSCYVLNISMEDAFSELPYGYSPTIVGLLFIPSTIGCIVTSVFGGAWIDRIMVRAAEQAGRYDSDGQLIYLPEDRMGLNAWVSLTVYPASLIWYGWTVQYGVHWIAPSIAVLLFGAGSMMVFSATTTMLTEFMPRTSSSGVALNNFIRNIFSCIGTIVAQPLIDVMGHGWLLTMVGLVAWTTGNGCVYLLRRNSQKWRMELDKALND